MAGTLTKTLNFIPFGGIRLESFLLNNFNGLRLHPCRYRRAWGGGEDNVIDIDIIKRTLSMAYFDKFRRVFFILNSGIWQVHSVHGQADIADEKIARQVHLGDR